MRNPIKYLIIVAALAMSPMTAAAGGNGGSGASADADAAAAAVAMLKSGDAFSFGASVGAAECAKAFNVLGLVAGSKTDYSCAIVKAAAMGYQAGLLTKAEARTAFMIGLCKMGVCMGETAKDSARIARGTKAIDVPTPAATSASTKSSPNGAITVKVLASSKTEITLRVQGVVYSVKGDKLDRWNSGAKLNFGGTKLRKSDLPA
jgi:hypothetical protein